MDSSEAVIIEQYFHEWFELNGRYLRRAVFSGSSDQSSRLWCDLQYFIWCRILSDWNSLYSSRRRKPVEDVWNEARRRGYQIHSTADDIYSIDLPGIRFMLKYENGRRTVLPTRHESSILPGSSKCLSKLDADKLFDLMRLFSSKLPEMKELLDDSIFRIRQSMNIDRIVLPLISLEARKRLDPKGVRYFLENTDKGLVLCANIVKELWFSCVLDADNYERIIGLTPYAIARPDDLKCLGPSAKVVHDWNGRCEASWRKYQMRG